MKLHTRPNRRRALTLIEVVIVMLVVVVVGALVVSFQRAKVKAARISCVGRNKMIGFAFRIWANDNDDKFPYWTPMINHYPFPSIPVTNLAYRNESNAWLHFYVMSNELGSAKTLICRADRERVNNRDSDFGSNSASDLGFQKNRAVSYFIGLEADETRPQVFLAGDRNLETNAGNVQGSLLLYSANQLPVWTPAIHGGVGNVCLSDGSVQQMDIARLQAQALQSVVGSGQETNRLLMPW